MRARSLRCGLLAFSATRKREAFPFSSKFLSSCDANAFFSDVKHPFSSYFLQKVFHLHLKASLSTTNIWHFPTTSSYPARIRLRTNEWARARKQCLSIKPQILVITEGLITVHCALGASARARGQRRRPFSTNALA